MGRFASLLTVILSAAACFAWRAQGCTGITLKAENGDVVCGRTMEWGESDCEARILVYPRGYEYSARVPKGFSGMSWKGKYGMAGLEMFRSGRFTDAMNEKGLRVGLFYFPGFADYPEYDPSLADREIAPTDVVSYLLSTCANLDEAEAALQKVEVAAIPEEVLGFPSPVHFMISEQSGRQIVVEWANGKPKIFNCPLGVITNAPTYDWHVINLRNYIGMTLDPKPDISLDGIKLAPLGVGSGFLGLPGDFTPPSRFIRAVVFTQTARKTPDGAETLYEAFRIMDNFNVPLAKPENAGGKLRSATAWTIAYDMPRKAFYYHTQNDRRVQKVDLEKIDFGKLDKTVILPLDDGHQTILDRTGDIAAAK
ncbi:MAG: linear amide C-N hydrolase [Victivallaceae bacterium]|nr:choloylglycine hydrolase family protein [Victivallaceae bacterium]